MTRKISYFFLILVISIYVCNETLTTYAEQMNVTDCLEANEDCLEELEKDSDVQLEQNENEDELLSNSDSTTPPSMALNFAKMFFALLLVLALIYGILIIIRRRNKLYQHSNVLENLGGIPLGTNKSIQLVRVGTSIYMVGVGENVQMLQELTDEEVKSLLLEKERDSQHTASSFLQNLLQQKSDPVTKEPEEGFSMKLQSELKKIRINRKNMIDKHDAKDDEHV